MPPVLLAKKTPAARSCSGPSRPAWARASRAAKTAKRSARLSRGQRGPRAKSGGGPSGTSPATCVRWRVWSKRWNGPMAVRPDRRPRWRASTPQPKALTAPRPVMTARRSRASLAISGLRLRLGQPPLDEAGQAGQRPEHALVHLVAGDADPVFLLQRDHELQRVHGIQAEAGPEERLVVPDALRGEAVEVERGDDQLLEIGPDAVFSHRVQGSLSSVPLRVSARARAGPHCGRKRRPRCASGRRWGARAGARR